MTPTATERRWGADPTPEHYSAEKVSYVTSAGHLMLVFRQLDCDCDCVLNEEDDDAEEFDCSHEMSMLVVGAERVYERHPEALDTFRVARSVDELCDRLDAQGIAHGQPAEVAE